MKNIFFISVFIISTISMKGMEEGLFCLSSRYNKFAKYGVNQFMLDFKIGRNNFISNQHRLIISNLECLQFGLGKEFSDLNRKSLLFRGCLIDFDLIDNGIGFGLSIIKSDEFGLFEKNIKWFEARGGLGGIITNDENYYLIELSGGYNAIKAGEHLAEELPNEHKIECSGYSMGAGVKINFRLKKDFEFDTEAEYRFILDEYRFQEMKINSAINYMFLMKKEKSALSIGLNYAYKMFWIRKPSSSYSSIGLELNYHFD